MNALAAHSSLPVEAYFEELKKMRDELQRILQQHRLLLTEHRLLKQKVDRITEQPSFSYPATRSETGDNLIATIIYILQETSRPMSLTEIVDLLRSKNMIPIQILNAKTYVCRRLETACSAQMLCKTQGEDPGKKYYYLPE